ncbi:MAG: hypothetical protein ACSHYB_08570 [Roseibacillus sp.]
MAVADSVGFLDLLGFLAAYASWSGGGDIAVPLGSGALKTSQY